MTDNVLVVMLAQQHQEELRREAEAVRRAVLLENPVRDATVRDRLGRALIRLGGVLVRAEAAQHAERA